MPRLTRRPIAFLTMVLGAGCDLDPAAVENLEGASPAEAAEVVQQELRFGSFSFADPAVGRLQVAGGCTATLIDPQAVVTAAHCVDYRSGPATGTFRVDHSNTVSFTYAVERVRSFGSGVGHDDVAIVRLTQAVPSNVAVPLGLNRWGIISMHERVTMYGYGCRATLGDSYAGRKQRYDTRYDLTIYACFGDSGGPMIKTMASGTRVVSKVFSGMSKVWPWDWKAEYGLVYKHAQAINDQADVWAGRPVDPPSQGGGGGGPPQGPDDPPTHQL